MQLRCDADGEDEAWPFPGDSFNESAPFIRFVGAAPWPTIVNAISNDEDIPSVQTLHRLMEYGLQSWYSLLMDAGSDAAPAAAYNHDWRLTMMNAFVATAKRCCAREHEQLGRKLTTCETQANDAGERHRCYRREAKASGARAKACMAQGNR